jgi:hypothetical protein
MRFAVILPPDRRDIGGNLSWLAAAASGRGGFSVVEPVIEPIT